MRLAGAEREHLDELIDASTIRSWPGVLSHLAPTCARDQEIWRKSRAAQSSRQPPDYSLPGVSCAMCNDNGVVQSSNGKREWCDCEQGRALRRDMPELIEEET